MTDASIVLVLLSLEFHYSREAALGLRQYAVNRGGWQLHVARPEDDVVGPWRKRRRELAGVIGYLADAGIERAVAALRVPTVSIAGRLSNSRFARVLPDNVAVGRLGAEHLLARGFRNLAYVGQHGAQPDLDRMNGFRAAVDAAGLRFANFMLQAPGAEGLRSRSVPRRMASHDAATPRASTRLQEFLRSLAFPAGIMAVNDAAAREVLTACRMAGLRVPEQIAIIGAENSEIHCELAEVPLSSVDTEGRRVGYEAAALLDRLISRRSRGPQLVRVPVVTVAARASTDVVAVDDAQTAEAIRFIRAHACDPATVDDAIAHAAMARRTLEKRFRAVLGRSPHEEIQRVRFERARELLVGSDMKVAEVARRSGFRRPRHFMASFRDMFGCSPTAFRTRHRRM